MIGHALEMVDETLVFKEFGHSAYEQVFEVSPSPSTELNSRRWNAHLLDACTDYADSLDPRFRENTAIDVRYKAPITRDMNNYFRESWTFDWNGKVRLARKVQRVGYNPFDLDDFARAATKFCLHGLNALLNLRPLPEKFNYSLFLSGLKGKVLENSELLDKPLRIGFVCGTAGIVNPVFEVTRNPDPGFAIDILRDQLLGTINSVVGAFHARAAVGFDNSAPRKVSPERFTTLYDNTLSKLHLRAIAAVQAWRQTEKAKGVKRERTSLGAAPPALSA